MKVRGNQMKRLVLMLLLLAVVPAALAQEQCAALTDALMSALQTQCQALQAGEGCTPEQEPFSISEIEGAFAGPALLSIPGADPASAVRFLLLADTLLRPEDTAPPRLPVSNPQAYDLNLRAGPGTNHTVVGALAQNATLEADGRSADGQWLRVLREAEAAWVFAELVQVDGDPQSLPVVEAAASAPPVLSYVLNTSGDCDQDQTGVLFGYPGQTPYRFMLNEAAIELANAIAYARLAEGGFLEVFALEGQLKVSAGDEEAILGAGEALRMPLEALSVSGPPELLEEDAADQPLLFTPARVTPLLCPGGSCGQAASGDPEAQPPDETAILSPAQVVQAYLAARVQSNSREMQALSCAAWDPQALIQSQSFRAMNAELRDVSCATTSETAGQAVVACDGVIVTHYNNQTREWPIRQYQLIQENDLWQICGEAG